MEAISYLGFAIQAADVSTRTAISLKHGYQRARSHREDRLAEYIDTIEEYHSTIEHLYSGGGALSADLKHPLGACLAKMAASLSSMRMLGGLTDIESQTSLDQHLIEKLTNDQIWIEFQQLKAELSKLERGLQHFATSCLLRSISQTNAKSENGNSMQLMALSSVRNVGKEMSESVESALAESSDLAVGQLSELSDRRRASPAEVVHENTIRSSKSNQLQRRIYKQPGIRCRAGTCPCRCHRRSSLGWGLISLRLTDVSSFNTPCNYHACDGLQVNISAQISYSILRLAVLSSLDVSWTFGNLTILPTLRVKRLVDEESAGFSIVRRFHNHDLSLIETVRALNKAFDTGEASRADSTQRWSLVDAIFAARRPFGCPSVADRLRLIEMANLRNSLVDSTSFDHNVMSGILFENDTMLEADVDTDILHNVRGSLRISTFYQITIFDGVLVDDFKINAMKRWIKKYPGFGDIPEGIEFILSGHTSQCKGNMSTPLIPLEEQWLGLNAIFWATTDASILRDLLAQSHDPNLTDARGRTPLFYAAAYGNMDSVFLLLGAGARPDVYDTYSQNFLSYALNGHPHVAVEALLCLVTSPSCSDEMYQNLLQESIFFACHLSSLTKISTLQSLCRLGANVNSLSQRGETLCHVLSLPTHAQLFFDNGFELLNMPGPGGLSCLHQAAYKLNAPLLRFYLNKGARLQATDNHGRNVLNTSLMSFGHFTVETKRHTWYSIVRTLIASGVDVLTGDNCRCVCSSRGCSPAKALYSRNGVYSLHLLPIEYLLLMEEMVDAFTAEKTLREVVSFFLFEDFELTHVCCKWISNGSRIEEDDEIREIQDEERLLIDQFKVEVDAVLERSLGRSPAEFFEELLFDYIAKRLRSGSVLCQAEQWPRCRDVACRDVACLECWEKDLSKYSDFISKIYQERSSDETLRDLDKIWLQKRKSLVRRCNSKIATLRNIQKDLPSAVEEL